MSIFDKRKNSPAAEHPSREIGRSLGVKKISAILMILSLCTVLFGCSGKATGPWQSLTYHVTSSVQTEGCHFSLARDGSGSVSISGYCFESNTEYRIDEARRISQETVDAIEAMELDKAASAKQKLFGMADGTQITVTLGYPNGSERKISLSAEQRAQLKELLQKELIGK